MNDVARRLIGVWMLSRYEFEDSQGVTTLPFGSDVTGMLIYSADGFMSAQVMELGRQREPRPMDGYIAYCGRWRLEASGDEVVHHVQASLYPKWVGGEQRRLVRFEGEDRLILAGGFYRDGEPRTARLYWSRAGAPETEGS